MYSNKNLKTITKVKLISSLSMRKDAYMFITLTLSFNSLRNFNYQKDIFKTGSKSENMVQNMLSPSHQAICLLAGGT